MFSQAKTLGDSEKRSVLILGGTRFIGKALAFRLSSGNFNVFISSRRTADKDLNVTQITCERSSISNFITDFSSFDFVVDFSGYSAEDLKGLPGGNPKCSYIFISTEWIERYVRRKGKENNFSKANLQYIRNKMELEFSLRKRYGSICQIVRIPKILGSNDHHHRLHFYALRAKNNCCQIVRDDDFEMSFLWVEDFVDAIEGLIEGNLPQEEQCTFVSSPMLYRTFITQINAIFAPSSKVFCYHSFSESDIISNLYFFAETDPLFLEVLYPHANIRRIEGGFLNEASKDFEEKFQLSKLVKRESFAAALRFESEFLCHAH